MAFSSEIIPTKFAYFSSPLVPSNNIVLNIKNSPKEKGQIGIGVLIGGIFVIACGAFALFGVGFENTVRYLGLEWTPTPSNLPSSLPDALSTSTNEPNPVIPVFSTSVFSSTPLPPPTDALLDPTVATSDTIFTQGTVGICNIKNDDNATIIETPSKETTKKVANDFCQTVTAQEGVKYTSPYDCTNWVISIDGGEVILRTVDGQTTIGHFDRVPDSIASLAITNACTNN